MANIMTDILAGAAATASEGSQIVNIRNEFNKLTDQDFENECNIIIKSICNTIGGNDPKCANVSGYNERVNPADILNEFTTKLINNTLNIDSYKLINYLTEYQDDYENNAINNNTNIGTNINTTNNDDINTTNNDDTNTTNIIPISIASAAVNNNIEQNTISGGSIADIANNVNTTEANSVGNLLDTDNSSSNNVANLLNTDSNSTSAITAATGIMGNMNNIIGQEGDIQNNDAKHILKTYTNRIKQIVKCNQNVYANIKSLLESIFNMSEKHVADKKFDIIKDSLKTQAVFGRNIINKERINIYTKHLKYLSHIEHADNIKAYIYILNDMYPYLINDHKYNSAHAPLTVLNDNINFIKSKKNFTDIKNDQVLISNINSELSNALGLDSSKYKVSTYENTDFDDNIWAIFTGGKSNKKITKKNRKRINNRTRHFA